MNSSITFAALAAVCLATPASADAIEDFYKDKQIQLIVGYETGGGYDSYARTLIRHMPQYIPGKPTIIVRNMPGAGSLIATNYLYAQAPKDGTTFAAVGREMPTAALFGQDNIRFKTEEFTWIGNMESAETFCGAWHTVGITKAEELFEKPLIVGGTNGDSITVTQPIALNNLLGTKFKLIAGYRGGADMHLALQRGEIEGRCAWTYSSLQTAGPTWIQDGTVKVLLVAGLKRSKRFPDVPIAPELAKTPEARQALELLLSQDILARPYLAPPKVPDDRVNALRKAFDAAVADASFTADIAKQRLDLSPMGGEEMEQIIAQLYATPKLVVEMAVAATKRSASTDMKSLPAKQ
jgi:tripartite-type tricarboxylate transporter receptor subunit TctC